MMTTKTNATKKTANPALPPRYQQLHAMLSKAGGATITEISTATGWQRHSARGVLSTARSRYGWLLEKDSDQERGTIYRIATAASTKAPKVSANPKASTKPKAKVAGKPKAPAAPRKTKPVEPAMRLIEQPTA